MFWAAKMVDNKIIFYRAETPTKNANLYVGNGDIYKFLKVIDNEVVEMTEEEKQVISQNEEQARLEQEQISLLQEQERQAKLAEEQALEDIRQQKIGALRTQYRLITNQFCTLANLEVVDKIEDSSVIINAVNNATDNKQDLFMISMQLKYIIDELRRPCNDGDNAWDNI